MLIILNLQGFNRASVELKLPRPAYAGHRQMRFNRTSVELKQYPAHKAGMTLIALIEPVWN